MSQEPQSPIRLLVAGAGPFGREHLERVVARPDVSLVGVADANPTALDFVRARHGVERLGLDPLRMIDETPADAIIIATPAASHVEICERALRANLCVLLEKPVAEAAAAVSGLIAVERDSEGFVLPGHVLRFSRDHARLVDTIRSGLIGEVVYVNSRRYRDDSHALRYPDTDPILMTMIHDIDLAQWIAGAEFRSVLAHRSAGSGFRSMTAARAITATGVICDLRTAWTFTDGELPPDTVEVIGDRGGVELVFGHGTRVYAQGRAERHAAFEGDDPLRNEQDHFFACIRDRSLLPALGLRQALAGLRLTDAAMESLRRNGEAIVSAD